MWSIGILFWACLLHFANSVCPDGWTRLGHSCYFISDVVSRREHGEHNCTTKGGVLAQIDGQKELDFLRNILRRFQNDQYMNQLYWIDGIRSGNKWTLRDSQTEISFFSWGIGQPSNHYGREDCLTLFNKLDFYFNDESCFVNAYYICEIIDPVQSCSQTTNNNGSWVPLVGRDE